jgi:class 3 adenylate cyclase
MSSARVQLEAAISAVEAQRSVLGDAVVEASVRALREQLAALTTPSSPDPAQSLKQVTVLFLDVVGSTSLGQHLDPEAIGEVMDGALHRLTELVEKHRGKVLQYAGDNILAVFGADESREDDAELAVQCGLAMLALGKVLGVEVETALGHTGFDVRVGIHTGDVLLGGGVDAEGAIRGSAVNVAARMEQTAPAGRLRISHDTYALVRGLFDAELQPPLTVKGIDRPVQSYLVTAAKPRPFRDASRGIEGVPTRMIGRASDLTALQDHFRRLFTPLEDQHRLAMVIVVADAGIGKSRLLREFEAWAHARPDRFHLLRGRATPQTQVQPFGLFQRHLWTGKSLHSLGSIVERPLLPRHFVGLGSAHD